MGVPYFAGTRPEAARVSHNRRSQGRSHCVGKCGADCRLCKSHILISVRRGLVDCGHREKEPREPMREGGSGTTQKQTTSHGGLIGLIEGAHSAVYKYGFVNDGRMMI